MRTDEELLGAWRSGDAGAGKEIFARHYEAVARFFRNKVGDEAPDLVQTTFLGCVEGAERFRGEGSFRSFLFAVAYRQLCKHYRARIAERARLDPGTVTAHDLDPTPSRVVAQRQEQRLLLEALRRIPFEYQVALELHYWERMSTAEIAVALDAPQGTMKSRLRRGRALVEEQIQRLTQDAALLESTQARLEDWAMGVRDQVLSEPEEKKSQED